MESQPQNPDFRINPENFHPCAYHLLQYKLFVALKIFFTKCRLLQVMDGALRATWFSTNH